MVSVEMAATAHEASRVALRSARLGRFLEERVLPEAHPPLEDRLSPGLRGAQRWAA